MIYEIEDGIFESFFEEMVIIYNSDQTSFLNLGLLFFNLNKFLLDSIVYYSYNTS